MGALFELSKEYVEQLEHAIEANNDSFIRNSLDGVNPADISAVLEELNTEQCKFIIDLLPLETGATIIKDLDQDTQEKFLKVFDNQEIANFLNELDSDDGADILNELPIKVREDVITKVNNEEKASYLLDLLRYSEDCAGGLMAKELIKANLNWNVVQCIEEIRRQAEKVQKLHSVYVVDNLGKLLGRVSLKRIILSDDNTKIAAIYDEELVSVETDMEEEEVASIMQKYDLEAVPVVNVRGILVGRITIDDILDVITDQAEEERQIMSGISEDVEEDDSVWMLTRARLPWLVVGMAGGILGAQFIGLFEESIAMLPAMAFFIPLITATGGNVGIQSSSIVVQSLAERSVFGISNLNRVFKGLIVAIINGIVLASIVFLINGLINDNIKLSLVVSAALFSVVLLASFMGTITPLILNKLGVNPALASGPFITTANDLLGLAVYFSVAKLLYA